MAYKFFATSDDIESKFKKIKKFRHSLYSFFSMMPKGGDLHHHYSGSLYTETYIDYVIENDFFLNIKSLDVYDKMPLDSKPEDFVRLKTDFTDPDSEKQKQKTKLLASYRSKLIRLWSVKDFIKNLPNDEHFFECFDKFSLASKSIQQKNGLIELKNRALNQNLSYIESMLMTCKIKSFTDNNSKLLIEIDDKLNNFNNELAISREPLSDSNFIKLKSILDFFFENMPLKEAVIDLGKKHNDTVIKIFENNEFNNEEFTLRLQNYISRNSQPSNAFISMAVAFQSCSTSDYIFGVNIVSAENGILSMKYYNLHMLFYKYFEEKYPKVKYCVHAGELVSGLVKPEFLGVNIKKALTLNNLRRIGHGVDIIYDNEFSKTIKLLRERNEISMELKNDFDKNFDVDYLIECIDNDKNYLVIEINLSSNEFILNVKDDLHPVELYYRNNIPIVICTDDEGILRTSITEQFAILTYKYGFNYKDIKKICFDSIRYSHAEKNKKVELFKKLLNEFDEFEKNIDDFISIYADNEDDQDFNSTESISSIDDLIKELNKTNVFTKFKGKTFN